KFTVTKEDYVKVFEDYFSELQADMIAICLEYVENEAENIYIYCSYEPEMYVFDFCYKINGNIVHKHQLNEAVKESNNPHEQDYEISKERQVTALKKGNTNLTSINEKCKKYDREMPTEIKLHYNVTQNSLNGNYKDVLVYSIHEELLPDDMFDLWFE